QKNENIGIIIGNLVAADDRAASFATVELSLSGDTAYHKKMITDKNGAFEFTELRFGYYRLSAAYVGHAVFRLDSIYLRADRYDFNLGDLRMKSSDSLEEVVVYVEKPLIDTRDGKITYNVGESALSAASTTAEIIKNMPLISNDPNGKILLKGKEPKILIDDKPTELNAQQLADLLESLPGSSIEKIELMTNPPPQYANEAGGVINIVTKKGKIGLVGRVNLSAGTRGEGQAGLNLSYRQRKFSFNLNTGVGVSEFNGSSYSRRQNFYTDSTSYLNTDGSYTNRNLRPNLRFQTDYEINKSHSLNLTYQGNLNFFDNKSSTTYTNLNNDKQVYKISTRTIGSEGNGYSHGLTLAYNLKGKRPGENLKFIASANTGKNEQDRDFYQQFLDPYYVPTGVDSSQLQLTNNKSDAWSLRLNYDRPFIWKGSNISAGLSYVSNSYHNILNTSFLKQPDSAYITNDLLSSDFEFNQGIFQARAAWTVTLPREWKLTAGIIGEQTEMEFRFLDNKGDNVGNNYWNVLPAFTVRKEFSKELNTSLTYRSTIRRPGIGELNPAIDYGDPYNTRFGNPFLSPQIADNFDWNLSWYKGKFYFNTSAGFNRVRNVFNTIRTLVESGKTEVTWQNIADRNEYEASIWGGYTFSKKFRMNASAGYSFNEYGDREKELYKYRNGSSFYTSINYNFTPSSVMSFEGNARYNSFADPQGRSKSNLRLNIGVQRKFFSKRLTISFNIIDPFSTQQFTTFTYGKRFLLESHSQTRTRNFRIAVSYQLNKLVQKKAVSDKQKQDAIKKAKAKQQVP
ncbi:MAG TPA: outer membrane beta-barrel protein, partial [Chitinophagaceae bacterium]